MFAMKGCSHALLPFPSPLQYVPMLQICVNCAAALSRGESPTSDQFPPVSAFDPCQPQAIFGPLFSITPRGGSPSFQPIFCLFCFFICVCHRQVTSTLTQYINDLKSALQCFLLYHNLGFFPLHTQCPRSKAQAKPKPTTVIPTPSPLFWQLPQLTGEFQAPNSA